MSAPSRLAELVTPRMNVYIAQSPIAPRPNIPQAAFLVVPWRECLYGGAAGGAKTSALLMAALQYVDVPGYSALLLRRTFRQLELSDSLVPRAQAWLSGTDAVYTEPSIIHAGAEKLFVSARISMASSNGTLTIDSEHSADGVTWFTGATLISAGQFATGAVTTLYGQDAGGDVRACYMRFKISFGSSIDGFVRVIVTGRYSSRGEPSSARYARECARNRSSSLSG